MPDETFMCGLCQSHFSIVEDRVRHMEEEHRDVRLVISPKSDPLTDLIEKRDSLRFQLNAANRSAKVLELALYAANKEYDALVHGGGDDVTDRT